jgi:F-type H+-transporting ATPase subunit gamma
MASIKDLKRRITSVKNTQQTTKAMKMVSAAKLRRAQDAITAHRPYARQVGALIGRVARIAGDQVDSPLLRASETGEGSRKLLLVLVSSDRGLCGGFNTNVIKTAQRWMAANSRNYAQVRMGFVGRKAYDIFKNRKIDLALYDPELGGKVTFAKATTFASRVIEMFTAGEVDEVKIIYNEFKNAVSQTVLVEDFLPLPGLSSATGESAEAAAAASDELVIVKPSAKEVLESLLAKHFSVQAFRIMLESQASEHGARMSAMENATKNAGEMIRKLSLQYNKQRQAGITKELLEIIAGSESAKA